MIYKQQRIVRRIPTCAFSINDLDALINLCLRFHQECHERMKQDIMNGHFKVSGVDNSKLDEVIQHIENSFLWTVEMFGANGEYLFIQDLTKLNASDIPLRIEKFKFGNLISYDFINKKNPSIYFEIVIDFKNVKIFDLISSPTNSTSNDSEFVISGIDLTTVNGFTSQLENFFLKYKNYNGLINAQNAYDILLWLGFFPLMLTYLLKYENSLPKIILDSPVFIQALVAIVCFFLLLYFFRCLFNLGRWFFPCQELTNQTSRERKVTRILFSVFVAGILGTIGYNVMYWLYERL